jgi:hypothetical protein
LIPTKIEARQEINEQARQVPLKEQAWYAEFFLRLNFRFYLEKQEQD